MVNEPIFLKSDNKHYIKGITTDYHDRDNIDGVEISGYGGNTRSLLRVVQNQFHEPTKTIIEMYGDMINCHKPIWMNTNAINFWKQPYTNHQILHSFGKHADGVDGTQTYPEMNGILIRAWGDAVPFCRFQSSYNSSDTNVMDLYKDKIKIHTNLNIYDKLSITHSSAPYYDDDNDIILSNDKNITIESGSVPSWHPAGGNYTPILDMRSESWGRVFMHADSGHVELHVDGKVFADGTDLNSDDRFKSNEVALTNCLQTILKLQPEIYTKELIKNMTRNIGECPTYIDDNGIVQQDIDNWPKETYSVKGRKSIESGFIAQDTYNNVPELRHLVSLDETLLNNPNNFDEEGKLVENVVDSNGIPSYIHLNYVGIIPYLTGAIKEMNTTINTLQTENNELKSIIDKLKNANSFEEFKQTL